MNERLTESANTAADEQPVAGPSTIRTVPPPLIVEGKARLPKGKGRIIRDATGKVVGVEIPGDDDEAGDDVEQPRHAQAHVPMRDDRVPAPVVPKTDTVAGMYIGFLVFSEVFVPLRITFWSFLRLVPGGLTWIDGGFRPTQS